MEDISIGIQERRVRGSGRREKEKYYQLQEIRVIKMMDYEKGEVYNYTK